MTLKAVLLDLDDTLVYIDTDRFTQRYIELISTFMAERFPVVTADHFKKAVITASRQVSRDLDPLRLNQTVINGVIASTLPIASTDMNNAMADFFAGPYRTLSTLASAVPGAQALIDWLLAHNITVVIATNPLFPAQATHERLRWAGFDSGHPGFALITTADNSHFTKPHVAYYSEILAKIDVDPVQALMIGDSFDNDIQPALAAGMSAYWIMPNKDTPDPAPSDQFGRGSLVDLVAKLAAGWPPSSDIPANGSPVQVSARLLASVAALDSVREYLVDWPQPTLDWSHSPSSLPDLNSPLAVLMYWRQIEADFNRPTLERIALEDNPFITLPQILVTSRVQPIAEILKAFFDEREQTLFFLATLSAADWQRPARDAVFGPTTLLDLANLIQRQDRQLLTRLHQLLRATEGQP